jgi:hypothetical protein
MTAGNDPLEALRPLHPPTPVGWWPPAPGWWVLAALVLGALGVAWWHRRRTALRRAALIELRQLERSAPDDGRLAIGVNLLLRRVALACFPRRQVAALSGEAWLRFLDTQAGGTGFSTGPGRVLATAPFAPKSTLERPALLALARQWIREACRRRP